MALPELSVHMFPSVISSSPLEEDSPSVSTADGFIETLQLRESYFQLQERYVMMESAARAEISELRARLQEAHQRLADMHTEQAVSGLEVQMTVRKNLEVGLKKAEQTAFLARSEVRLDLQSKLQSTGVHRLIRHRASCSQLRCWTAWRTLIAMRGLRRVEPLQIQGTIVGLHRSLLWAYNCWRAWFEHVHCVPERYQPHRDLQSSLLMRERVRHRHQTDQQIFRQHVYVALQGFFRRSASAKHVFIAWQYAAGREVRTRLRRLVDLAHDSWHVSVISLYKFVVKNADLIASNMASRCFYDWLSCYKRHRQLARFWRWFGKEHKFMRRWFSKFLQALVASQRDRIRAFETSPSRVNGKFIRFDDFAGQKLLPENSYRFR